MTKNRFLRLASRASLSLAVLPVVFAFASPAAQQPHAGRGTVTGVLELVGGPYPGHRFPRQGTVIARRHGKVVTIRTAKHGRYVLHLAPGRYIITGKPRHTGILCRAAHPVTVHAGQAIHHVFVNCPVP
jgi:hypothetical protein